MTKDLHPELGSGALRERKAILACEQLVAAFDTQPPENLMMTVLIASETAREALSPSRQGAAKRVEG